MSIHELRVEDPRQPLIDMHTVWLGSTRPLLTGFHQPTLMLRAFFTVPCQNVYRIIRNLCR